MEGSVKNLLEAEKESQAIIEAAMKQKTQRVADAKLYAEQELNKHRKDYEEKFQLEAARKQQENAALTEYDQRAEEDIKLIK